MSNSLEENLEGLIDQRLEAAKDQEDATDVVPDSGAQVTTDKLERPQTRDAQTFRLLRGLARGNQRQAESAAEKLVRGGHYGTDAAEQARSSGDYYSTVVNADGQFLLPTEVRQTIEELADQVGVARQVVNTFSQITGTLRVPGASGAETSASAVAEGGTITSTKRAFEAVELNPQKWATVVPWTYEADILSGSRSGVGQLTLASGSTAPEDIDPDDIIVARNEIDPGARQNLTLIFHPDMEAVFRTKKDDSGEYLFMYNDDGDVDTINGIPVLYTEVLPATGENTGTDFGVLVNGDYWHMALGQGLTTEEARTGTVEDADTGSDINLFTQDLRALKVRSFFDMDANFNSAFMKFTTAAS